MADFVTSTATLILLLRLEQKTILKFYCSLIISLDLGPSNRVPFIILDLCFILGSGLPFPFLKVRDFGLTRIIRFSESTIYS
jgi:hypothetical protein